MKTKYLIIGMILLGINFGTSIKLNATNYFVKESGNGTVGLSWDDAISGNMFVSMLRNNGFNTGDVIYFSGGTYKLSSTPDDTLVISNGITLIGGFNPASTGANTSISYPTNFETVFSGDINGDGISSEGDAFRILTINTTDKVILKGLTITNAYYAVVGGSSAGAIYARNTNLEIQNCKISNNSSGLSYGGGGLTIESSTVRCYQSSFSNNTAAARGGAIRLTGNSANIGATMVMDQCLVTGNSTVGDYAGAIHLVGTGGLYVNKVYIINSTITNNTCGGKGGGAISVAKGDAAFIISSTLANNNSTLPTEGNNIRLERKGGAYLYMINSICVDTGTNAETSVGINASSTISGGGNYVGGTLTTVDAPWMENDAINKLYSDAFGNNTLASNGGPTQTIIPVISGVISASDLSATASKWLNTGDITADIAKDQRGYERSNSTTSIGAYDGNSLTSFARLKTSGIDVFPTITTGILTINGTAGKTVRLMDLQGSVIKKVKCVNNTEIVDLSSFAKGIYLLCTDSEAIKIMLK